MFRKNLHILWRQYREASVEHTRSTYTTSKNYKPLLPLALPWLRSMQLIDIGPGYYLNG